MCPLDSVYTLAEQDRSSFHKQTERCSRGALTSTEHLVENTITQDVFLTVGLLPADFESGRTESRKDQSAGGIWNPRGKPRIWWVIQRDNCKDAVGQTINKRSALVV